VDAVRDTFGTDRPLASALAVEHDKHLLHRGLPPSGRWCLPVLQSICGTEPSAGLHIRHNTIYIGVAEYLVRHARVEWPVRVGLPGAEAMAGLTGANTGRDKVTRTLHRGWANKFITCGGGDHSLIYSTLSSLRWRANDSVGLDQWLDYIAPFNAYSLATTEAPPRSTRPCTRGPTTGRGETSFNNAPADFSEIGHRSPDFGPAATTNPAISLSLYSVSVRNCISNT